MQRELAGSLPEGLTGRKSLYELKNASEGYPSLDMAPYHEDGERLFPFVEKSAFSSSWTRIWRVGGVAQPKPALIRSASIWDNGKVLPVVGGGIAANVLEERKLHPKIGVKNDPEGIHWRDRRVEGILGTG